MTLSAEAATKAAESMWGIYELAGDALKICVSTNTAIK